MKVTSERLPKSLVALDIELDSQQVNKGLDQAARKLSQQYAIPGFRPGKAPRFMVENYLGRERILEEASDALMNAALKDAMKSENIAPVGQVKLENFEADPFRFRVLVPVEPTVELADYRSFQFPLEAEEVSDEIVQRLLDAQREQHVVLKPLETPRPAQEGDLVSVRMESDLDEDEDEDDEDDLDEDEEDEDEDEDDELDEDDEDLDEDDEDEDYDEDEDLEEDEDYDEDEDDELGEATDIILERDRARPEFFEALLGAEVGESRTVTVSYGDDDANEELRGKAVTYSLTVEKIQERLLPDWEELPTLVEFEGDFEALRANARERLVKASDEKARREVLNAFLERAVQESTFDVPDAMIEERSSELFHQQVAQFQRYGLTEEQLLQAMGKTHEEAIADYAEQAEKDVRTQLVLREIIQREELSLDDSDIAAETERFLEEYEPDRREEVRQMLETERMQQMVASTALDRKLRDRVVALATGQDGSGSSEPAVIEQTPDDVVGIGLPANAPLA